MRRICLNPIFCTNNLLSDKHFNVQQKFDYRLNLITLLSVSFKEIQNKYYLFRFLQKYINVLLMVKSCLIYSKISSHYLFI